MKVVLLSSLVAIVQAVLPSTIVRADTIPALLEYVQGETELNSWEHLKQINALIKTDNKKCLEKQKNSFLDFVLNASPRLLADIEKTWRREAWKKETIGCDFAPTNFQLVFRVEYDENKTPLNARLTFGCSAEESKEEPIGWIEKSAKVFSEEETTPLNLGEGVKNYSEAWVKSSDFDILRLGKILQYRLKEDENDKVRIAHVYDSYVTYGYDDAGLLKGLVFYSLLEPIPDFEVVYNHPVILCNMLSSEDFWTESRYYSYISHFLKMLDKILKE